MVGNNRGIALILTMWILLALILLAAGISMMAHTEVQISRNYADVTRCRWVARAGVYQALAEIKTLSEGTTTYLGEEPHIVSSADSAVDLGDYSYEASIIDEAGRMNINTASAETLTNLFGVSDVADCIVDWRDSDDTPGAEGAEAEYYSALDQPYKCKNANFSTVRELLLVKGLTEDILTSPTEEDGPLLINLLTVYEAKSTTQAATDGQVDIQSANQQSLQDALGEVLSPEDIDAIIKYRTTSSFQSVAEIVRVPGLDRSKIVEIYDRLTVSGEQAKSGRVNVNTASANVLAVQQGMDSSIAQAIVDYRSEHGALENVGQLLDVSAVTDEAFVAGAPSFTVKSNLFRIVSTGRMEKTGASATITCIVEVGGTGEPQIRYWQE